MMPKPSQPQEQSPPAPMDSGSVESEEIKNPGCGILAKFPVLSVLVFALVGIAIGIGLSIWTPEDPETKNILLQWLGLVGDMFIRSLQAIVLPLVFVNVIISVVDMMTVGKAGSIGWKTIGLYLFTTVCTSILGILSTLAFKRLYNAGNFGDDSGPAFVQLGCSAEGRFVAETDDGLLTCSTKEADQFVIEDLSGTFMRRSSGPASDISLSDTVYDGVFRTLITANISGSFAEANFAAVIFFAIVFGVGLAQVLDKQKKQGKKEAFIMTFLKELDQVLLTLINWVIDITPFAVISLIINAVGGQENLAEAFANVGFLVLATAVAMLLQILIVYLGLFFLVTRTNPITYLRHIAPAQTLAFACASSAATIPMTLKSVKSTGVVTDAIARFVIPLGATVNMDGGDIYFPCASIWLAVLNGNDMNFGSYLLLVIISTLGSVGTAPVPLASLVLIITAYNTVFSTTGTPDGFSFILAIDWFMDRLRTTLNVSGNAVVAGMVAHMNPFVEEEDMMVADDMPMVPMEMDMVLADSSMPKPPMFSTGASHISEGTA